MWKLRTYLQTTSMFIQILPLTTCYIQITEDLRNQLIGNQNNLGKISITKGFLEELKYELILARIPKRYFKKNNINTST